jgi:predicted AlkP superfamily phosphohydrolase/phosphomutase
MRFRFGKSRRRAVGIGLDGLPYSLAEKMMYEGIMPNLYRLAERGRMKRIKSVYPPVSGVAWSAFQTGRGPAEFGVFGFVELKPDFDLYIPNYGDLKCETIWERLSEEHKRFAALGVPMTYPAPAVDGFLVSGFPAPTLDERAVSRRGVLDQLQGMKYEIDIDPTVAAESPERFKADLTRVWEARQRAALALLREKEPWDLFFLHVMETDRLHHFLWKAHREGGGEDAGFFWDFYKKVDDFLGEVVSAVGDARLMICSDHGFCELKCEVQLNRWLKSQGYLDYENDPQKGYKAVKDGSRAVSLVPGRVYILREGKWQRGVVTEKEYEPLRKELMDRLRAITHPETGEVICKQVMKREEIFAGPHADAAPDILVDPCDGYDLKAKLEAGPMFEKGPRSGMHTYDNAMLLVGRELSGIAEADNIAEVGRRVARYIL